MDRSLPRSVKSFLSKHFLVLSRTLFHILSFLSSSLSVGERTRFSLPATTSHAGDHRRRRYNTMRVIGRLEMSRSSVIGMRTNPQCIDDGAYKNRPGRLDGCVVRRRRRAVGINPTSIGSAGTVGTMLCRGSAANFSLSLSLSLSLSPSPLSISLGRSADKGSAGRIRRFWRTRH